MKKPIALLLLFTLLLAACAAKPDAPSADPSADAPASESGSPDGKPADYPLNGSFGNLTSFSAGTLDGGTLNETAFRGHDLTVVNVWGTYCGPCLAEMADLAAFAKSLPDRVQFWTVCVDADGNKAAVERILSEAGYEGRTLITWDGDLTKTLDNVLYIPTTLFFDENGVCVGKEIIGRQQDFSAAYTAAVNETLTAMGKDAL